MQFEILNYSPVPIFIIDRNFEIVFANDFLLLFNNISRSEIVGKNLLRLIPIFNHSNHIQRIEQLFDIGVPLIFSNHLHPEFQQDPFFDGKIVNIKVNSISQDNETFAIFTIEDLTEITNQVNKYKNLRDQALIEVEHRRLAEKSLLSSQERFKEVARLMPIALALINDGQIIFSNPAALELTEFSEEEFSKVNIFSMLNEAKSPARSVEIMSALFAGETLHFATNISTKSGNFKWIDLLARRVIINHEPISIVMATDISQRMYYANQIEDFHTKMTALINNTEDCIWSVDLDYTIIVANQATNKFLKVNEQDNLVGKSFFKFISNSDKEFWLDIINTSFSGKYIHTNLDLDNIHYEVSINPIHGENNKVNSSAISVREITARKKFEESLVKNEQKLIEANATKDKFFSIIAHDLKNPIGTIRQIADILINEFETLERDEMKEYVDDLKKTSDSTYNLLENLLEWSLIQRGRIKFSPAVVDLKILVDNVVSLLSAKAMSKGIVLNNNIGYGSMVYADPNMCSTIIRNLISNSLKFTKSGGSISVSCSIENNICTICINDTGVGISQENLEKLFKKEEHITTAGTASEKGTGLGLILCKEFVELNGGVIWAESQLNKGSQFYFTLSSDLNYLD